ncbi:MAG TPA: MBL fold metallo-hydrolase [Soehngenia sp.]|nr:MBL fold metallo-hydrolase [Soehngenia sp.]HPP31639.1 MBL fold metallo-hydrolase [Soehngenia sp.]
MEIKFFGATKIVTGSNILISTEKYKLLLDCGMFQGAKEIENLNYSAFPYDPKQIDYLILTHAHIDHSGRIPKLVNEGFRGRIISTKPTMQLSEIMLKDSAHIQQTDIEWENNRRRRSGEELKKPLYTIEEAQHSISYFNAYNYDQEITLNDDIKLIFRDAGHILGSAIVELWIREYNSTIKIVYTGDLGMPKRPILKDPEYIKDADYLIIESTYGNRVHENYIDSMNELIEIIENTANRGGTVLIPSFAVGRTQELIYELNKYYEYINTEEYKKIPIYIDSPMAIEATRIFQENAIFFDDEAKKLILSGDNPFEFDNLRYVQSQEESMNLNKAQYPKVIISASGMANAGRIRHHLKHNLWNPQNSLVFVGYQAEGTLGRLILDGVKKVKLLGEEIIVGLEVYNLQGFSAHADILHIREWLSHFEKKPKKAFVVHGEVDAANSLSRELLYDFGIESIIPNFGDGFIIKDGFTSQISDLDINILNERFDILNEIELLEDEIKNLKLLIEENKNDKILRKSYDILKNKVTEAKNVLLEINLLLGK